MLHLHYFFHFQHYSKTTMSRTNTRGKRARARFRELERNGLLPRTVHRVFRETYLLHLSYLSLSTLTILPFSRRRLDVYTQRSKYCAIYYRASRARSRFVTTSRLLADNCAYFRTYVNYSFLTKFQRKIFRYRNSRTVWNFFFFCRIVFIFDEIFFIHFVLIVKIG